VQVLILGALRSSDVRGGCIAHR